MLGHAILTTRSGRRTVLAAQLLLLVLAAFATAGCRKEQPVGPRLPPLVTVGEANLADVPLYIDEIGSCSAAETVAIQPQATGQILQRHFVDGADLKKDDLLFTIDPRPYQAAVDQAQAALAQSQASQALAKAEFERAETLLPTKAISKEEYEIRKSAMESTQAQGQASLAAIQTAKLNLKYCFIRSPTEGRAGQRLVDAGNIVYAATPAVLLVIQRMDPIYADFTVTERELSAVRGAMVNGTVRVRVRLPEEAEDRAREGDLTFLDNAVQAATGTVRLRATLANADRHFWPGQFVRVRLVLNILKGAVLVPSQATQISQAGPYVYVLDGNGTAQMRPVRLGQPQGQLTVVQEGLQAGEKVVTSGQITIRPGSPVRVQEAGSAQAARSPQQAGSPPKAAQSQPGTASAARGAGDGP